MIQHASYPLYRESDVEWLGDVPSHWAVLPLWAIAEHNRHSLREKTPKDYRFRYVDISSVAHGKGIVASEDMDFGSAPSRARRLAEPGDVVVSTVRTYLKAVGTVRDSHRNHVFSTGFAVIHAKNNCHPGFLHWLIENERLIQAIEAHSEGLGYPAINASTLMRLKTALPPRDEQEAISDRLSHETTRIDTLIQKKTRFIELLKEKRAAVISHAVTKGIDPDVPMKDSGVEWLGAIPAHWRMTRLGYCGRSANGINIRGDAFGSGYPFVSYGDVYKNRQLPEIPKGLVESSTSDRITYSVKSGDIFFTRTSETVDEIGLSSVCVRTIEHAVFAGFLIRVRPYEETLIPLFSKYAFQHTGLRDFFSKEMNLVTRASLSQGLLHKTPVPLPPLSEQSRIAEHLETQCEKIDRVIYKTKHSIDLLREKRSALITAAVTGKIDVREAA